jgi:hypothetical protein
MGEGRGKRRGEGGRWGVYDAMRVSYQERHVCNEQEVDVAIRVVNY